VAHVAGVSSERSLSFSSAQEKSISLELMIKNPKLWWPSGYGDPFLFDLKISSNSDFATRKIGFRSIKLVEEDYSDDIGKSFYFKINGLPIFIKGSNLIPFDPFSTRIHGNDYRKMLENAVLANMNMIRVWGGGMYQFDEFYDIADELGIMIRQEFVFACGMYPRNDEFLENVKIEVRENVKRLGYHASIAIFGGNNENEEAFWWYPESAANIQLYMVDYAALYLYSVYPTLFSILYDREWVQSSPSGGKISSDPLVYRFGALNDIHFGDKHFYDYENDCTDVSHFPRARFISEYGQQSWPSFDLLKSVSDVMDWGWDSNFSYYRQRHPDGQFQLNRQMRRHFTLTNATLSRSAKGFDDWIYLTQITQVRCYTSSISYWRRIKHESPGKTMGVLYWQLNDIWQGPSWSSVQYDGKWKPLHYHIKNVFAGVLVSAQVYPTNNFSVYVTSDVYSEFESSLHINLWTWSGEKVKSVSKDYISVSSFSSEAAFIDSLSNFLHPFTESDVFAELVLTSRDGNVLLSRNEYFFGSFSLAKIEDPRITVRLIHDQSDPKIIRFELESMSIAPFVFLESNL
jgi:beta-mannosidase